MQHDRTFMRPFPDALSLLQCMQEEPRLKMVGLPTTTNDPPKYMTQAVTKMGEMKAPLGLREASRGPARSCIRPSRPWCCR